MKMSRGSLLQIPLLGLFLRPLFAFGFGGPIKPVNHFLVPQDAKFGKLARDNAELLEEVCRGWSDDGFSNIPQGYTYLSQFLTHDIAPREGVSKHHTWKFDLASVYGPVGSVIDAELKFDYTRKTGTKTADLLREKTSQKASIPEFRNDDQFLIAQLHLLVQLFHNKVMDLLAQDPIHNGTTLSARFELAKAFVVGTMQRIVREELLPALTETSVARYYLNGGALFTAIADSEVKLPFEFTHASLRFGHSMVRNSYALNDKELVSLARLFELTGEHSGAAYNGVDLILEIGWHKFFPGISHDIDPDQAQRLNPHIVAGLSTDGPLSVNAVRLNLRAGAELDLCSGQQLAQRFIDAGAKTFGISTRIDEQVFSEQNLKLATRLKKKGLWKQTPIWLYILLEAYSTNVGNRLGPFGSVLLWEAVTHAMSIGGKLTYEQEIALLESVEEIGPILTMSDLVRFIN